MTMESAPLTLQDYHEGVWDELEHLQSREIEQHHARLQRIDPFQHSSSTSRIMVITGRIFHQALDELRGVVRVFYQAATDALEEQRRSRPCHELRPSVNSFLNDFGINGAIDETQGDPLIIETNEADDSIPPRRGIPSDPESYEDGFTYLPNFRFRPHAEGWGAVSNLDLYFTSLYNYYYHRGMVPIISRGIVEIVTLIFTLFLSVLLLLYVDWSALTSCKDESTCRPTLADYLVENPFSRWTLWTFLVIVYCVIFVAFTAFTALSFLSVVQDARQAKWVFEERLGISSRRLEGGAIDWDRDVVQKLLELQRSGEYRFAIHGQELDALVIANRILRKENFLVALFNRGLLDLSVPGIGIHFFNSTLEWSIYFCVLNFMFNHKYQIRPAFYLDPSALRHRFVLCGVAHLLFMPFLLFFVTLYFGLLHAYDWKSTKQYLGPKDWSLLAKWTFREFNELQHHFERRITPSYQAAEDYLKLFGHNEIIAVFGRVLVFVGGSLGTLLIAFAAISDAILLHVKIGNWNLLWYAGIVGVIFSGGKSMIPKSEAQPRAYRNLFEEMDRALASLASHTHHYPQIWKGRGWEQAVFKTVTSMFRAKAHNFAMEVAALILAPYILCVSLAGCAEPICEFILAIKAQIPGSGEVCGYSTFDFARYGDESWDRLSMQNNTTLTGTLTESVLQMGSVDAVLRVFPKPKARYGKMYKSFISFQECHPSWKTNTSEKAMAENFVPERDGFDAIRMEQEVHIEAATRQLETLAALEQGTELVSHAMPVSELDESHIGLRHVT